MYYLFIYRVNLQEVSKLQNTRCLAFEKVLQKAAGIKIHFVTNGTLWQANLTKLEVVFSVKISNDKPLNVVFRSSKSV